MADLCCGRGTGGGGGGGKRPGSDVKAGNRRPPLGAFASYMRDTSCLIKDGEFEDWPHLCFHF